MSERWRPIIEFSGYDISSLGRVRCWLPRNHRARPPAKPRVLLPHDDTARNHMRVNLRRDNKGHTRAVHTLVLSAFVGVRPAGCYGCHNDGDYHNNRLSNLRWDTPKSNQKDRVRHGHDQYGENNASCRLTNTDVLRIDRLLKRGLTHKSIAEEFGVSRTTITQIANGKRWGRLTRRGER